MLKLKALDDTRALGQVSGLYAKVDKSAVDPDLVKRQTETLLSNSI